MKFILNPSQLMLIVLASWINREQQQKIECLETQLAVLKEQFGSKRILLTDDQRRRIAVKGKVLGRKQLSQMVSCLPATRGREASTIATAKPELERTSGTHIWNASLDL